MTTCSISGLMAGMRRMQQIVIPAAAVGGQQLRSDGLQGLQNGGRRPGVPSRRRRRAPGQEGGQILVRRRRQEETSTTTTAILPFILLLMMMLWVAVAGHIAAATAECLNARQRTQTAGVRRRWGV